VVLLTALERGCADDAITVVAMAQAGGIDRVFTGWRGAAPGTVSRAASTAADGIMAEFAAAEGDAATLLNVYRGWEGASRSSAWAGEHRMNQTALHKAAEVRGQLRRALRLLCATEAAAAAGWSLAAASVPDDAAADGDAVTALQRCLLAGYCLQVARCSDDGGGPGRYTTLAGGHSAQLHPSSVFVRFRVTPAWVVFGAAVRTSALYLRDVTAVDAAWLVEEGSRVFALDERKAGFVGGGGGGGRRGGSQAAAGVSVRAPAPTSLLAGSRATVAVVAAADSEAAGATAAVRYVGRRERQRDGVGADVVGAAVDATVTGGGGGGGAPVAAGVGAKGAPAVGAGGRPTSAVGAGIRLASLFADDDDDDA